MTNYEHCANCDRPLGRHRFVSDDGKRILCGRCFGAPRDIGGGYSGRRAKLLDSTGRRR